MRASIDVRGVWKLFGSVWKLFGSCSEAVWKLFGIPYNPYRCVRSCECVRASVCVRGVWKLFGSCLEVVRKLFGIPYNPYRSVRSCVCMRASIDGRGVWKLFGSVWKLFGRIVADHAWEISEFDGHVEVLLELLVECLVVHMAERLVDRILGEPAVVNAINFPVYLGTAVVLFEHLLDFHALLRVLQGVGNFFIAAVETHANAIEQRENHSCRESTRR